MDRRQFLQAAESIAAIGDSSNPGQHARLFRAQQAFERPLPHPVPFLFCLTFLIARFLRQRVFRIVEQIQNRVRSDRSLHAYRFSQQQTVHAAGVRQSPQKIGFRLRRIDVAQGPIGAKPLHHCPFPLQEPDNHVIGPGGHPVAEQGQHFAAVLFGSPGQNGLRIHGREAHVAHVRGLHLGPSLGQKQAGNQGIIIIRLREIPMGPHEAFIGRQLPERRLPIGAAPG